MRLQAKTALITGAARGIGRAIAEEFAAQGASLVLCDIHPIEPLPNAITITADVADRAQLQAAFNLAPRVDIVVANAAFSVRKPLLDLTVDDVERTWAVSLWGVFHTAQLAARRMIAQPEGGNIIVVSSVHSFRPYPGASTYNAAKAAVNQMAATWAVELAQNKIRVNVLEPGWVDTPGERAWHTEAELQTEAEALLLGRLASAREMARAALFLASDDSSYMTGSVLRVDGGYSLHH